MIRRKESGLPFTQPSFVLALFFLPRERRKVSRFISIATKKHKDTLPVSLPLFTCYCLRFQFYQHGHLFDKIPKSTRTYLSGPDHYKTSLKPLIESSRNDFFFKKGCFQKVMAKNWRNFANRITFIWIRINQSPSGRFFFLLTLFT